MLVSEIKKIDNLEELLLICKNINGIDVLSENADFFMNDKILLKNSLYSLISAQKQKICKNNCKKINLKKVLKNKLLTRSELFSILIENPNTNRNIGNLPKIFLESIENKKECSNAVFDLFARYSQILNYDYIHNDIGNVEIPIYTKEFEVELKKLIKKSVRIEFVGSGCNGNGFKITVIGKNDIKYNYFYKNFYQIAIIRKDKREFRHGGDLEAMFAYYANKNGRKKQFVKFYMGRIASPFEKDAFLLTDYLEVKPDFVMQKQPLFLDYIYSEDKRIDNTINGKTVDFGGLVENIPELRDKNLRRTVRIILQCISRIADENNIRYIWEIKNNNLSILKDYAKKCDKNIYKKSVCIIKKYIPTLPKEIIHYLNNVKVNSKNITIIKQLETSDIITKHTKTLKNNIKYLQLRIIASNNASKDMFGYIILDLFQGRQAVYILDKDNNITRIRIERKIDNKIKTILELQDSQIETYTNSNITELLCENED